MFIVTIMLCAFPWHERNSTWGVVLLVGHYLADKNLINKVKRFRWRPVILLSALFFGFHFLAMLWSDYPSEGWRSIETKISLLILPFILSTENYLDGKNLKAIMPYFFISCSLAFGYDLAYSIYHNYSFGWEIVFQRMNISQGIMHPGYFSNYFAWAILYLAYEIWHTRKKPHWAHVAFLALFLAVVVLMLSKTVILFILFLFIFFLWKYSGLVKNIVLRIIGFSIALFIVGAAFYMLPPIKGKVNEMMAEKLVNNTNPNYANSTETRFVGYQHEWYLIKKKAIMGYGTGSANPVFYNRLKEMNFTSLLENNMHTHQQFFHTWLDLGLVGLLLLLGLCIAYFLSFLREKKPLGFWMTILFFFTMLTDDALEIQAMGVFFIFMLNLLVFSKKNDKRSYTNH